MVPRSDRRGARAAPRPAHRSVDRRRGQVAGRRHGELTRTDRSAPEAASGAGTVRSGPTAPPVRHVVGLGDSVPAGSACACSDYVSLLARSLGEKVTSTNLAVPGQTSSGLLAQMASPQVRGALADADVIVVTVGANDVEGTDPSDCPSTDDGAACYSRELATLEQNLDRIAAGVGALTTRPGARLLLTGYWNVFLDGTAARAKGTDYLHVTDAVTREVNGEIRSAAAAHGSVLRGPLHPVPRGPTAARTALPCSPPTEITRTRPDTHSSHARSSLLFEHRLSRSFRHPGHDAGMDIPEALDFVRTNHNAVLATTRADGSPQLSPVTVGVDDDGRIVVSTRETAVKTRNLRRDPRAFVCVFTDGFFGPWVQLSGTAEIVSLPEAMEPLVDYYRGISGEHPDWDDYRAAMRSERRVLLRITPTSGGPERQRLSGYAATGASHASGRPQRWLQKRPERVSSRGSRDQTSAGASSDCSGERGAGSGAGAGRPLGQAEPGVQGRSGPGAHQLRSPSTPIRAGRAGRGRSWRRAGSRRPRRGRAA